MPLLREYMFFLRGRHRFAEGLLVTLPPPISLKDRGANGDASGIAAVGWSYGCMLVGCAILRPSFFFC